jgi:hypothetical protein
LLVGSVVVAPAFIFVAIRGSTRRLRARTILWVVLVGLRCVGIVVMGSTGRTIAVPRGIIPSSSMGLRFVERLDV